jgi:hypothetical protein
VALWTPRRHRVIDARAYADWTQAQLEIDAPNLYRAGIEPVYAQGRYQHDGSPVKNSAVSAEDETIPEEESGPLGAATTPTTSLPEGDAKVLANIEAKGL